jgi:hypothetical protein
VVGEARDRVRGHCSGRRLGYDSSRDEGIRVMRRATDLTADGEARSPGFQTKPSSPNGTSRARTETGAGDSIVIAVVPITDALMPQLSRPQTPLEVPERALVDRLVFRLQESAELTRDVVQAGLADPEVWPGGGDWLVVSCLDDGTAQYGVAPFGVAARVTNPQEACAAITRELGD